MPNNRIAHLSSAHPACDDRIFEKECRSLADAGYDVVLVAPHDRSEVVGGVRVHGVPIIEGRMKRMTQTVHAVYRAAVEEDAAVYHLHDPELLPVAVLLRLRNKRVIFDFHEDFPLQVSTKNWIPKPLRAPTVMIARFMTALAVRSSHKVVAATPGIAQTLPLSKTGIVQNYPVIESFGSNGSAPYAERAAGAVYIGAISAARGVKEMVQAMSMLPADIDSKLFMAGEFQPSGLLDEVQSLPGWERTRFVGFQPRHEIAQLLARVRIGLVLLHPAPNYIESQPVKLYEYMTAGLPVVASDFPYWRRIVDEAGCGLLVDPKDPRAIADAIEWLFRNPKEAEEMGKRGREAVFTRYNWRAEVPKLLGLYEEVLH